MAMVKYLETRVTNQNDIHGSRQNEESSSYLPAQNFLSSGDLSESFKIKLYKTNFTNCFVWV
jgi:hypothetical protein